AELGHEEPPRISDFGFGRGLRLASEPQPRYRTYPRGGTLRPQGQSWNFAGRRKRCRTPARRAPAAGGGAGSLWGPWASRESSRAGTASETPAGRGPAPSRQAPRPRPPPPPPPPRTTTSTASSPTSTRARRSPATSWANT